MYYVLKFTNILCYYRRLYLVQCGTNGYREGTILAQTICPLDHPVPVAYSISARMSSAAFSATMYVDTAVNVPGILG